MKIEPTYLTFEQCKMLKEKGLNSICQRYWVRWSSTDYKEMSNIELVTLDYEIGIGNNLITPKYEQHQVIEWLRLKYGIWIDVGFAPIGDIGNNENPSEVTWWSMITKIGVFDLYPPEFEGFNTPQEAYSAAFDYILKNNLI